MLPFKMLPSWFKMLPSWFKMLPFNFITWYISHCGTFTKLSHILFHSSKIKENEMVLCRAARTRLSALDSTWWWCDQFLQADFSFSALVSTQHTPPALPVPERWQPSMSTHQYNHFQTTWWWNILSLCQFKMLPTIELILVLPSCICRETSQEEPFLVQHAVCLLLSDIFHKYEKYLRLCFQSFFTLLPSHPPKNGVLVSFESFKLYIVNFVFRKIQTDSGWQILAVKSRKYLRSTQQKTDFCLGTWETTGPSRKCFSAWEPGEAIMATLMRCLFGNIL